VLENRAFVLSIGINPVSGLAGAGARAREEAKAARPFLQLLF
jgi:hypothetical protein